MIIRLHSAIAISNSQGPGAKVKHVLNWQFKHQEESKAVNVNWGQTQTLTSVCDESELNAQALHTQEAVKVNGDI